VLSFEKTDVCAGTVYGFKAYVHDSIRKR